MRMMPRVVSFLLGALILAGSLTAGQATAGAGGKKKQAPARSASREMVLTKEMLALLPKGRFFDGLEAFIPGAMSERVVGGLAIGGASAGENAYDADGQNTDSPFAGRNPQAVAIDFVDEVRVRSTGIAAEFTGALGGVVSVVTRAGSDEFHGDLSAYYSGSALRGRERDTTILNPAIAQPALLTFNYEDRGQAIVDSRLEAGFGIGGPVVAGKLWFYAGVLPVVRKTRVPAIFLFPSRPDIVASSPYTAPALVHTYDYGQTGSDLHLLLKLSTRPLKNLRFSLSYIGDHESYQNDLPSRDGTSSDAIDYSTLGYAYPNWTVSGSIDYSPGSTFMANARVGYHFSGTRNDLDPAAANAGHEPQYYFSAGNTALAPYPESLRRPAGWQSRSVQSMTYGDSFKMEETLLSAGADLTCFLNLAGAHALKAGIAYSEAGVKRNTLLNAPQVIFTAFRASDGRASVSVNGGPNSLMDTINGNATGQFGDYAFGASERLALYLQDSWAIGNRLTLNVGVRLESETVPSFNDDPAWRDYWGRDYLAFALFDKVAPRLGFVWDAMGDSRLRVFAGYGVYCDPMKLDLALRSAGGTRWVQDRYYLPGANAGRIFDIGKLQADGSRDYSFLTWRGYHEYRYQNWPYVDPGLKPMSQREMTAGIEKKMGGDLVLSVRATWRGLIRAVEDIIIRAPNIGMEYVVLVNPGEGWGLPYTEGGKNVDGYYWPCPKAQRDYRALDLSLEKRMSRRWLGGVLLTISRLYGNYTGIVSGDEAVANSGAGLAGDHHTFYFDYWWMNYKSNGKRELTSGLLPGDRPLVLKAYGAYAFPWGLTVGGVANWMSGTPRSTEFYVDGVPGYYPLGRNDLGRTPGLWFLNLYAEYGIRIGDDTLQLSVSVDNATDNAAATWYYNCINNRSVPTYWEYYGVSNLARPELAPFIKNGYDLFALEGPWPQDMYHWTRDPRYNRPILYQAPISARLGVKFIF